MSVVSPILQKQKDEIRTVTFEFADKLNIGDTIVGASVAGSVTTDTGITAGAPVQDVTRINTKISGGSNDQNYRINCRITTTQGEVLELDVIIQIREGVN